VLLFVVVATDIDIAMSDIERGS